MHQENQIKANLTSQFRCLQYTAPNIEIIEIEFAQNILTGSTPDFLDGGDWLPDLFP